MKPLRWRQSVVETYGSLEAFRDAFSLQFVQAECDDQIADHRRYLKTLDPWPEIRRDYERSCAEEQSALAALRAELRAILDARNLPYRPVG